MSLANRDVLTPDAVMSPGDMPVDTTPVWEKVNPCPNCRATPHESPEGLDPFTGVPAWTFEHCWRCGFRASADPTDDMRRREMFEAFQKFYAERTAQDMAHPTLSAPQSDTETEALRQQVESLQNQLAERNAPNTAPTSSQPMTSGSSMFGTPPAATADPVAPSQDPGKSQS